MEDVLAYEPEEPPHFEREGQGLELPELNEPQAKAVAHVEGPLLIFAGAGSGKTRVIVYRIANLVATHRVPPYRILSVTFTNKAAQEMRHRLEGLIGPEVTKDLWVGTFHATCVKLLRRYHEAAGLEKSFVIYDDGDQRSVMNRVVKELGYDDKRYPPRQLLHRIHAEKQEGRSSADFVRESYFDDAIGKCFEGYERHLKAANAVDFDDLLLCVLRMVEDKESLAGDEIRRRFRHVLVDEFQDVNQVQYRLVRAMAGRPRGEDWHGDGRPVNLCVVGDDDQSIYRWRGADVRIVRGFRRDFPDATVVKLEQNYRSTSNVVRGALGIIKPAKEREPKELWTSNGEGERIGVIAAENEHDEAAFVAERIRELVNAGTSPRQIAVFYRTHAQSRVLEEVLRAERIPYQIIGGMRFFERAEIKDLLSYLRVVTNPRSDVDLLRVINVPSRKLGDTTIEKLVATADARKTSLYEALGPLCDSAQVNAGTRKSLLGFRDLLQGLMREAQSAAPSDVARIVLERTGYEKMLEDDDSAEAESRKQNLGELIGSIVDYEAEASAEGEEATLDGYLARVTLASDQDSIEETPKVAMMTVHAAKGLEFEAVFITGMEEDLFPFRSQDPKRNEDDEEERRLAYVAVTRARAWLWITHAQRRLIFGQPRYGLPSRFIGDLPPAVLKQGMTRAMSQGGSRADRMGPSVGAFATRMRGAFKHPFEGSARNEDESERTIERDQPRLAFRAATGAPARPASVRSYERTPEPASQREPGERFVEREDGAGDGTLEVGAQVTHERFGSGVVERVDDGKDPLVTVRFSGWGTKRIKASFLRF